MLHWIQLWGQAQLRFVSLFMFREQYWSEVMFPAAGSARTHARMHSRLYNLSLLTALLDRCKSQWNRSPREWRLQFKVRKVNDRFHLDGVDSIFYNQCTVLCNVKFELDNKFLINICISVRIQDPNVSAIPCLLLIILQTNSSNSNWHLYMIWFWENAIVNTYRRNDAFAERKLECRTWR